MKAVYFINTNRGYGHVSHNVWDIPKEEGYLAENQTKIRIMYGTADPSHRYFLLNSDGRRFIFGYDSQEHHPEPAFMADVHGGQNP